MAAETVDFYVTSKSLAPCPLPGVLVKVFSADGRRAFAETLTDVAGRAGFLLDSGVTYQARFFKPHVRFTSPVLFEVLASPELNQFDLSVEVAAPPASTDPRLCVAYGYFRTITGAPAANVDVHVIAKFNPLLLDGDGVLTERVITRTDDSGYAEIPLIRCGQYDVTVQGLEDYTRTIEVPDAANVNLPDLLFPVVASVCFTESGPYAVRVGQEIQLTPTVLATDGRALVGVAGSDVVWSSSDTSILAVLPCGDKVTLRGLARGQAEVRLGRLDNTIVRYPERPIGGQPVEVTVT